MRRKSSSRQRKTSSTDGERVKVHVRIRPSLPSDQARDQSSSPMGTIIQPEGGGKVNVITGNNSRTGTGDVKSFQFDAFFDDKTTQEEVYDQVARPIIDGVLDGYNGTLFAYGQTGTGKTYTMLGNENGSVSQTDGGLSGLHDERGIIPRSLDQIFSTMRASAEDYVYEVSMSYVQLYCELLQDLLEPDFSKTLTIRESTADGNGSGSTDSGVFIQGLSSFKVNSKEECMKLLRIGAESRAVAETNMNAQSSRSHAAVVLNVERRPRIKLMNAAGADQLLSPKDQAAPKKTSAKLFIVDLAGSERVRNSGNTQGVRFNELKSINLSLSALGNCISSLSEKKRHIPFRDSKLTRLLQDSLGGNARTALVINISPCDADTSESLSSLSFGQRAMAVATRAHRNIEVDYKALYATVQSALDEKDDEIRRLEITQGRNEQQNEMLLNQLADAKLVAQRAEAEMKMLRSMNNNNNNNNNEDRSPMKKNELSHHTDGSPLTTISNNQKEQENNEGVENLSSMDENGLGGGLFGLTAVGGQPEEDDEEAAAAAAAAAAVAVAGDPENEEGWSAQLDQLRAEYQEQLQVLQINSTKALKGEKEKRLGAEEEWNRIEYDLRGEREEHLRTCIQLKECRAEITKLDRDTTERIGELTADNQDLREAAEKYTHSGDQEVHLREELAKSGGVIESVREKYRAKIDSLELFYGEKIAWLTSKVEKMEEEKQQRRDRSGDEYDRPSSSDLLQPEEDEEDDRYYGSARLRRQHGGNNGRRDEREMARDTGRGRTMARRNGGGGIRDRASRSTSRTRSVSNQSIDRLHGGGRKGSRKKPSFGSYNGSLNSFGSSMKRSKSNTGTRRRKGAGTGAPSFTKRSSSVNKRRSKSGPAASSMSAAERRKQYSMKQRYPVGRKSKGAARGGGAGAIKMLRGAQRRSRDPVPKRRTRRAW